MKRSIYTQLLEWRKSPRRKPLMLYGARQVGKTYILKEFGNAEFDNLVYINCDQNPAVKALFSLDMDISRILLGLSALSGQKITPQKTLVFLDEVQEVPDVVASLKYFCEEAPEIAIVAAGSLLGVMNMEGRSFPAGKVDIMRMYPMSYIEFLDAVGESKMSMLLDTPHQQELVNALIPKYVELLRQYYFVGGMPEAVTAFIESKSPAVVRKIQEDILAAYEADIAKHAAAETQRARLVFQSIPSQLAKENKRFIFGVLKMGARAAEFYNAIQWLVDAGLVYKIPRLAKADMPLKFYMEPNSFKLFVLDVGLLGAMAQIPPAAMLIGNNVFSDYKGAFTENYVLTQMICVPETVIAYYSKDNSTMEIDFIVQAGDRLLPIEVKAEENVKSKSLRQFITVDKAGSGIRGVRFSMKGFVEQDWMENVPLFAVYSYIKEVTKRSDY